MVEVHNRFFHGGTVDVGECVYLKICCKNCKEYFLIFNFDLRHFLKTQHKGRVICKKCQKEIKDDFRRLASPLYIGFVEDISFTQEGKVSNHV